MSTVSSRRFPVLDTLVVLLAVGVMIRLGFWQLDRLHQKEAMIAQYQAYMTNPMGFDLNRDTLIDYPDAYSKARVQCVAVESREMLAERNAAGQVGWGQVVRCRYVSPRGKPAVVRVVLGWSRDPVPARWSGGSVSGLIVPEKANDPLRWHIVADPPLAGLAANARPDPRDLPNNHLSYAVQWFLFAATALVIYAIALAKRMRGRD